MVTRKGDLRGFRVFERYGRGIFRVDRDLVGDRRHKAVEVDRLVHVVEVDRVGYALYNALEKKLHLVGAEFLPVDEELVAHLLDAAQEERFSGSALVLALVRDFRLHCVDCLCLGRRFVFRQQVAERHDLRHEMQVLLGPLFVGQHLAEFLLAPMNPPGVVDVLEEREVRPVDPQLEPLHSRQSVKLCLLLLIHGGAGIKAVHFFS